VPTPPNYLSTTTPAFFDLAACRGKFPQRSNPFFPLTRGNKFPPKSLAIAFKFCDNCPVRQECLTYARSMPGVTGVWGGHVFLGPRAKYRESRNGVRAMRPQEIDPTR
jgi:hypothetical protein